jgi:ABC-type multidrug transport system ATPase subunit/ABC-type multidrug transport system permease subunit
MSVTPPEKAENTDTLPSPSGTDTPVDDETVPREAISQLIRRVSTFARQPSNNVDPFDIEHPDWTLERTLIAAIERSNEHGAGNLSPHVSLAWENVSVFGDDIARVVQKDATSLFTDLNQFYGLWGRTREKTILSGIDGLLSPGEMLLVLGPPQSGCTSLLKVLAGQTEGYRRWSGSISYSGVPLATMQKRFSSMMAFNGELDNHFPYLTVSQTLDFAASTKTPHQRMNGISRTDYIKTTTKVLLAAFGLQHTANTRVGNDFVRGVSGGERRRVSIAEMLLTRACVTCWDNPTRGLDSSTSLDFAQALRVATNLTDNVSISALYQPGNSLLDIYDKVLLLHQGRQIFFGTLEAAHNYFEEMGYAYKSRQTIAEFLVSVTDPNARALRAGFEDKVPRTAQEFADRWRTSGEYHQLQRSIEEYNKIQESKVQVEIHRFKSHQSTQKAPATRTNSPYNINIGMQFNTTFLRACQRIKGEYAYFLAITVTMLVIPLVIGSMFYNIAPGTSGFFSKGGLIFFVILFNIIVNFAETVAQFSQRPIVEKHHAYGMYHPYIDALSSMISQYPLKFVNILVFSVIIYFTANLKREIGPFFIFVLFVYISTLTMTAWFRLVAALANTVEAALAVAGISMLPLAMYGGYIIPRPSMHPWFKWISYVNPIYYTVEALMANEFHNLNAPCQVLIPSGHGFENASIANQVCTTVGARSGSAFVLGDDYIDIALDYHYAHIWRNLGISIAIFAALTIGYALATEFKKLGGSTSSYTVFRKGTNHVEPASDLESGVSNPPLPSIPNNETKERPSFGQSKDVFSWKNMNFDIEIKGNKRRLLSDVQGFVEPGTLTALMGASGAGKTTLLNVLAQRTDIGMVSGDRAINGVPLDESFKRRTGYVQQQDVHLAEMTVREAFQFSALLRQARDTPEAEKYTYVEEIIAVLGMEEYAEAVIGVPGKGLSAEKRKRTTIGIELVARPSLLLFLDEPTSGLDSQSASSIINLLRDLADAGQAILCTIHQPSATLLEKFDRLLLLASGGKTVYFGDLGKDSQNLVNYFAQYGPNVCPADANPAEWVLEQVGAGASAQATLDWPCVWATSKERQAVASRIESFKSAPLATSDAISQRSPLAVPNETTQAPSQTFATTWLYQYSCVQRRLFVQHWRSPAYINSKLFINIFGGLFLAFTFYKEESTIQGLQNKMFAVFMVLLLCLVLIVLLQPRLIVLREIYDVRERYSNMYHWSVFVVASIIVEIPFNVVISSFCFICWFFPVGWWHDVSAARSVFMWFVFVLYQLYHTTFSQAIAIVSPNAETAAMLTILLYTFILAFSGVLQPLSQLVNFWHFAYYVSPFTWLVSALMFAGTHNVPVRCAPTEINIFQPPNGTTCGEYAGAFATASFAAIYNPDAMQDCEFCQLTVSDTYLASMNIFFTDRWRNVGLLVVYTVFNIIFFVIGFYLHSGQGTMARLKNVFQRRK